MAEKKNGTRHVEDSFKISIITCFLNTEPFIRETIESVLKQDFRNWELLLIDDGSEDSSTNIAKEYASKHPGKIIYLEHDNHVNKGSSASRNLGLKKATGKFISFLDADDTWHPGMLANMVNLFHRHPVAMICEASEYWYDWNQPQRENETILIGAEQDRSYNPPELMLTLYPLSKGAAPCICGIIVQKEVLARHGGFDESFKGMYDDQAFLVKFYLNETVFISSSCKNRYRQRPGSLVHSSHQKGSYLRERRYFLAWLKKYLKRNNIDYPKVDALLRRELSTFKLSRRIRHALPSRIKKLIQNVYRSIKLLLRWNPQ